MKNLRNFMLFLLAFEFALGRPAGDCGRKAKRYYLSIDKANFFQAFINCKNGGMELASAENEDESNALDAFLDPYKVDGYANGFWLSGTNLNSPNSKQYYWLSSGKPAIFTKWVSSEPDNYLGRQHAMSWAYFQGKTGWADDNQETLLRYVCEYKG